jgi:hypothetical protein
MMVRQRQAAIALVALAGCGWSLTACGSGPSSPQASQQTCQSVAAVLSDGPDPGADPVGYAEAQVIPLRQIHTSDAALEIAIDKLASAYEQFYETKGSAASKGAVTAASSQVNAICPGVAS